MNSAYHRRVAVPTVLSTAISPELSDEAITLFTPLGS
ncbi:mycofactocin biosynthesis peptidyl-dipeptidase MftE, partial [Mycobacteroides abscessus subsp. abscessus]|nr:mycofactocin biosynthesis peptidyl-dipeptidase MftE [Mycobacteroides abscessus subsp. abscessus]